MSVRQRIRFGGLATPDGYLFEITGGDLALDLANTVVDRAADQPKELLHRYEDFVNWATQAGLLQPHEAEALVAESRVDEAGAATVLRRALELRETTYAIFGRDDVGRRHLAKLEAFSREAAKRRHLVTEGSSVAWEWDRAGLDRMLWPIVHAATELLTSDRRSRVRVCAGLPCRWLFLDNSRTGNRRWCDMTVCGNRAKARTFLARRRAEQERT